MTGSLIARNPCKYMLERGGAIQARRERTFSTRSLASRSSSQRSLTVLRSSTSVAEPEPFSLRFPRSNPPTGGTEEQRKSPRNVARATRITSDLVAKRDEAAGRNWAEFSFRHHPPYQLISYNNASYHLTILLCDHNRQP